MNNYEAREVVMNYYRQHCKDNKDGEDIFYDYYRILLDNEHINLGGSKATLKIVDNILSDLDTTYRSNYSLFNHYRNVNKCLEAIEFLRSNLNNIRI